MKSIISLVLCIALSACSSVPISKNISYAKLGDVSDMYDVRIKQSIEKIPVIIDGSAYTLEVKSYIPSIKASKHPLVLFTHGRNGPNPPPESNTVTSNQILLQLLAARGYLAVMVVRRHYGHSSGPDSEYLPTPEESALAAAKDLQAAADYLRKREDVDPTRIIIGGHSQGGWAALAASTLDIPGMVATINFSGATNFRNAAGGINTPGVENPLRLSAQIFGKNNKVPVLWMYATKDNHSISTVSLWFSEFEAAGGKGTLLFVPTNTNGHSVVENPDYYFSEMLDFIDSQTR